MEQDNTKRIDIAAAVYRLSSALFRGHVLWRANTCSNASEIGCTFENLCYAKVSEKKIAIFAQQHVSRLHVAVNNTIIVGTIQTLRSLDHVVAVSYTHLTLPTNRE